MGRVHPGPQGYVFEKTFVPYHFEDILLTFIRASEIPKHEPLLWDVCGTFHALSIERVPLERASGTTQNKACHSNRTQYAVVR